MTRENDEPPDEAPDDEPPEPPPEQDASNTTNTASTPRPIKTSRRVPRRLKPDLQRVRVELPEHAQFVYANDSARRHDCPVNKDVLRIFRPPLVYPFVVMLEMVAHTSVRKGRSIVDVDA